ncbi:aminoglycoside 6'-N-acetyltransferase [Rubrivivax albus]|uniref:Aminoglycoside N(6')-acetyltransferase type 1 n=1 Tax=Rubrivivax albus TaxID=2499835 RepID=A0A437JKW2_9BURK|nr:aminoglycoside 6'-N-acetyltransferase [Rubrivivax albus]RVT47231.1 GNAT family N-acetyltransferase [Rubrivivax albus]
MRPEPLSSVEDPDWLRLRSELWPDCSVAEHIDEMRSFLIELSRFAQFVVRLPELGAVGFAEASIRSDYVAGASSSPVGFLEGLYVVPLARRRGVARALVQEVAAWAIGMGCSELASDTEISNTLSQAAHLRLGFTEAERIVCFNMSLSPKNDA